MAFIHPMALTWGQSAVGAIANFRNKDSNSPKALTENQEKLRAVQHERGVGKKGGFDSHNRRSYGLAERQIVAGQLDKVSPKTMDRLMRFNSAFQSYGNSVVDTLEAKGQGRSKEQSNYTRRGSTASVSSDASSTALKRGGTLDESQGIGL
ncbi:unnamed protein product [Vitrella brassicaformis CCMP3155]|uniref:Uncharacterized protein n=2 Tax=Vitrella brassicaformis TaxID=1169539 RepID=A0A0G4FCZ7_VITBC|nr:unnamed protein product [Vitrella brassicaformis CCMP3155]|mmetsp:Transcript_21031/g.51268  ORF Transcript_21031/g.51268 Transcript_21031/m.51268 type:complete len:151 (+) Transcript_21031:207-659(+)|eukprot:CEM10793.1 unnamed protein product [Vitrella brassicaformis CCMP3155]